MPKTAISLSVGLAKTEFEAPGINAERHEVSAGGAQLDHHVPPVPGVNAGPACHQEALATSQFTPSRVTVFAPNIIW